jgi:ribosomal protein S18 acetylase RimI-like enzyme
MRPSDEPFISELGRSAFAEYSFRAGPGSVAMARRGRTLVACERDAPVGFAVVELPGSAAHLSAITVDESARGRGVARSLLLAAESAARSAGARALALVTAESNVAALELFLRNGFERVGRVARYYQRGQDAVRLEKIL